MAAQRSAHTRSDTRYTPLRSKEVYALGQELWLGLSIGTTSKTGRQLQGGIELNLFASCIPSFEGLAVPTCKMGIFWSMRSISTVCAH